MRQYKKTILAAIALLVFIVTIFAQTKKPPAAKVTFYIVRHGETILNVLDRVQGWADAPLTPKGRAVAHALGLGLKGIPFTALYHSDLGRARETADVVLKAKAEKIPVRIETAELRESSFGSYEGDANKRMWTDIALYLHYISAAALFVEMQKNNKLPDALAAIKALDTLKTAEDFNDMQARMKNWLVKTADEAARAGGGNILVVSHGIAISALLAAIADQPFVHKPLGNASVSKVVFENGKFSILSVGDMQYAEAGQKLAKP